MESKFAAERYTFGLMPLVFPGMIVIMVCQCGRSSSSFWIEWSGSRL